MGGTRRGSSGKGGGTVTFSWVMLEQTLNVAFLRYTNRQQKTIEKRNFGQSTAVHCW